MEELRAALENGLFQVAVSIDDTDPPTTMGARYLYQHAKLYIADHSTAVVSSSNFTRHGLTTSREAGFAVTDEDDVRYFVERFDHYYAKAVPVADELLEKLKQWLQIYSPFYIYMRSLLSLYGLSSDNDRGKLPELAGYQRPIVSRIIRNFDEYGGSMLVASTGLGKTIMAAHAVSYLVQKGLINRAIVLCPAGLKSMWEKIMWAARVMSKQYSYYILSVEDWKKYKEIGVLEHELREADEKTVIILDESHHLRNAEKQGEERVRHQRIRESVSKNARVLLMTATPYSKGIDDINDQLALLPMKSDGNDLFNNPQYARWSVQKTDALSGLPSCVVLTAPSVVKYYSSVGPDGDRYVLFSGNRKRYFPKTIHLRNVQYENRYDDLLIDLLKSGLLNKRVSEEEEDELSLYQSDMKGKRDPLMEARIVHQFCSSLKEVDTLLGKMGVEGSFKKLRFEKQEELTKYVFEVRCELKSIINAIGMPEDDHKLSSVIDLINNHAGSKIVIFCHYRETAKYITGRLGACLPHLRVETTVEKSPEDIEQILKRFAPVANTIDLDGEEEIKSEDEIDVLVATGAMSEGFNFQDAPVLINFDLPWTVLVLAQRMGRILRPWHEPREIVVYNLIPSTMKNEKLHHALHWNQRLLTRNEELHSFSDIPVIVKQNEKFEMIALAGSMTTLGDSDLDLNQVLNFIEKADNLQSSAFIDDLAKIDNDQIAEIMDLPDGIKSYKMANVKSQLLYLLLKYRERYYPVIFNRKGEIVLDSEKMDEIMNIIRSDEKEEACTPKILPEDLDLWVAHSLDAWAVSRKVFNQVDLHIVCMMVLVPV